MIFESKRLILRPWSEDDLKACHEICSDPEVGPVAGWPCHLSEDDTRQALKGELSLPETYAIVLKARDIPIGSISIKTGERTYLTCSSDECEISFFLGKAYWGMGFMPEALEIVLTRAFEDLGMKNVLCGYYDGNDRSKRVQEKAGFKHLWTSENVRLLKMNEIRTGHVNILSVEDWLKRRNEEGSGKEK